MKLEQYKYKIATWICRIVMILVTIIFLYPIFWNVLSSFKTNTEFMLNPYALPTALHFENYVRAFQKANVDVYFMNSVFIVVASTVISVLFVIPSSYVLGRYQFFGAGVILNIFMACLFIHASYIMIPLFLILNKANATDNLAALSLLYAVLRFPFSIFFLTGFMKAIPHEYEEAARIDGCSNIRILISVIVPLAKPGIATVMMLGALYYWNEYPLAMVLLTSDHKKTLPLGLANLFEVQQYATDWSALFAALVIVLIPTLLIYLIGQKYLLTGVNVGGIKG
ncbi:MAG: carbohydrate ABC transporter permease [Lachnospiraceae bacterium]